MQIKFLDQIKNNIEFSCIQCCNTGLDDNQGLVFFQRTDEDDISSENDDTEYNAAQSGKFLPGQGFDPCVDIVNLNKSSL